MHQLYTVSYFTPSGPKFPVQITHIICKDEAEQARIVASFRSFYPDLSPLLRCLTPDSAREEIPFVHDPRNAGSAKTDRFFRAEKWLNSSAVEVGEPLLTEIDRVEFFEFFSKLLNKPNRAVVRRYERSA